MKKSGKLQRRNTGEFVRVKMRKSAATMKGPAKGGIEGVNAVCRKATGRIDYPSKIKFSGDYTITIYYSPEDLCYVANVLEFEGNCMAHGDTFEEALTEVRIAMKGWLKAARKSNIKIPEPISERDYSGKLVLRIPPGKHRQLAIDAKREGVSLNRLISQKL